MVRVLPSLTEKKCCHKSKKKKEKKRRHFINIEMEVFNLEVEAKRAFFFLISPGVSAVRKKIGFNCNNRGSDAVSLSP